MWIRPYGAPRVIESDQEGAFRSDNMRTWLDRAGTILSLKPKNTHTWMVETHHDILRQLYVRIKAQCEEEGLAYDDEDILTQAVIAKNLLTTVGRYSPQQAVFGKQPGILPDSTTVASTMEDADEGLFARQSHRLREIAVSEMITVSARDRIERANKSRTRDSAVLHDYHQDDKVEYWREPPSKGLSGWRGPATVVKVDPNGDVHVKYQSLIHTCRQQDVRPAMLYWGNDCDCLLGPGRGYFL